MSVDHRNGAAAAAGDRLLSRNGHRPQLNVRFLFYLVFFLRRLDFFSGCDSNAVQRLPMREETKKKKKEKKTNAVAEKKGASSCECRSCRSSTSLHALEIQFSIFCLTVSISTSFSLFLSPPSPSIDFSAALLQRPQNR